MANTNPEREQETIINPSFLRKDKLLLRTMNEKVLSLKIKDYLNRTSLDFKFKFIDDFCDIADEKNKIYI